LTFVVGCHAKRSSTLREQAPLTPIAQEIERRGYHAKERLIVAPTPWEISTFRMRGKRRFAFRANQPQPGSNDYYCRFSLFEETFDSTEDARNRLANLHLPSPDAPEDNEYERVMRIGFRVGTVAYFLQTDAIIFWEEVQRFARELANATPGAELTRTLINRSRFKSSDRRSDESRRFVT
jgi:hypothetical protein